MKAIVVTEEHALELRDIPRPEPGPYEALVKMEACGICSTTDRELVKGTQPYNDRYPCVLGHEAVGTVVETGGKVTTFKTGDRVTRPVSIWPGETRDGLASAWGGLAEYGIVRDRKAMTADGDESLAHDYTALRQNVVPGGAEAGEAVLAISLGETSSWFQELPPVAGKAVCVAGTGIAGLSLAIWSKLAGAARVVVLGRRKERVDLACELAADHGVNVRETDPAAAVKDLTGGGADFFFEAVGRSDQIRIGLSLLRPGGIVAVYGVPEKPYELEYGWLSGGRAEFRKPEAREHVTYRWALDLLRRGIVPAGKLMTHRWPMAEMETALRDIEAGHVVKGMIEM